MKCGVHVADATPRLGTYLGGFARLRNGTGVLEPLKAGALAFEGDGGAVAVLLTLDAVFAHEGWVARARQAVREAIGRPDAAVTIACSHSHQTPYATHEAPDARFQSYADTLLATCAAAARSAFDARVPVTLKFGTGETDIGVNRRMPDADGHVDFGWYEEGFYDQTVGVLHVVGAGDTPVATLVNHGCHPITMPPWSRRANPDWVGPMRAVVETATGAPCLFVQGACADINPRHEWVPRRFGKNDIRGPHAAPTDDGARHVIGEALGAVAASVIAGRLERVEDGPIRSAEEDVWLPLEPEPTDAGGALPYWRGVIRSPRLPRFLVDALLNRAFPWDTRVEDRAGRPHVPLAVQGVRIGGFALAAHGSEAFNETGAAIRAAAPTPHAFFVGYANGMVGYVPTPDAIPRGGYEVDMVPYLYRLPGRFAPDGEPLARCRTEALVNNLFT